MNSRRTISRRSRLTAAAGFALAVVAASAPLSHAAESTPPTNAPVEAMSAQCSYPRIEVWYDADQYGSYQKVWFKNMATCPKGVPVTLHATVWCKSPSKRVYKETVTGRTPIETPMRTMPPKSQCKSFYAEATATVISKPFLDVWHWNYGNYPA